MKHSLSIYPCARTLRLFWRLGAGKECLPEMWGACVVSKDASLNIGPGEGLEDLVGRCWFCSKGACLHRGWLSISRSSGGGSLLPAGLQHLLF